MMKWSVDGAITRLHTDGRVHLALQAPHRVQPVVWPWRDPPVQRHLLIHQLRRKHYLSHGTGPRLGPYLALRMKMTKTQATLGWKSLRWTVAKLLQQMVRNPATFPVQGAM